MMFQALAALAGEPRRYCFDTSNLPEVSKDYRLRLVGESDSALVNDLRKSAYRHTDEFQLLDLSPIFWDGSDTSAVVLAVEQNGADIASMRAVLANDAQSIVKYLDASWPSALGFIGPAMILERAATRPEFRRLGLNSLLRYCFIKMAMAEGVRYVTGTVYQGASRLALMESMGYLFFPIEENHDHWLVETDAPRLIAVLDLKKDGKRALELLRRKMASDGLLSPA